MNQFELSVSQFRRSLWRMLWIRFMVRSCVVGLWIAGCVILSQRLIWHLPVLQTFWTLSPLLLLIFGSAWIARKRIPSAASVRAAIDRSNQADGLVMADGEIELGPWKEKALDQTLQQPQIRWNHSRSTGGIVAAILFVFLTLVIPESWLTHQSLFARELDVKTDVEQLADKIEVLEDLDVLPKEDAEALRRELAKVEKDAQGNDPSKTLEAMSHMEDQLKTLAENVAKEASERARESSTLAAAAQTLEKASSQLSKESLQESMKKLAELTKKANDTAQEQGSDALEKSGDICKDGLSSDELQELSESLGECSQEMQELLDQLAEAGMLDPDAFGEGGQPISLEDLEMLAEAFRECEGMECEDLDELLKACRLCLDGEPCDSFLGCFPGPPSRGGVSRGPGAAKLQFSGESDEHGATFKNEVIMPGGIKKDAKMVVKKIGLGQPGGKETKELSTGGGLGVEAGAGGAHTRAVLPTHRRVVREYFQRGNTSEK